MEKNMKRTDGIDRLNHISLEPQKNVCKEFGIELTNLGFRLSETFDVVEIVGTLTRKRKIKGKEVRTLRMMADCYSKDAKLIDVLHSLWVYSIRYNPHLSFKISTLYSTTPYQEVERIVVYPMYYETAEEFEEDLE